MKYFIYSLAYGLSAYFLIGFIKGGWHLGLFESYPEESHIYLILLAGIIQTLIAVVLFGYPSNWISEWLRIKGIKVFKSTTATTIGLAALIALLHSFTMFDEKNILLEFLAMWVFLAPIPIILEMDEKHIKQNQKKDGPAWY